MNLRSRLIRVAASLPPQDRSPVLQVLTADEKSQRQDFAREYGKLDEDDKLAFTKSLGLSDADLEKERKRMGAPLGERSSANVWLAAREIGKTAEQIGAAVWKAVLKKEREMMRDTGGDEEDD